MIPAEPTVIVTDKPVAYVLPAEARDSLIAGLGQYPYNQVAEVIQQLRELAPLNEIPSGLDSDVDD